MDGNGTAGAVNDGEATKARKTRPSQSHENTKTRNFKSHEDAKFRLQDFRAFVACHVSSFRG
jgi:hypothetical protein